MKSDTRETLERLGEKALDGCHSTHEARKCFGDLVEVLRALERFEEHAPLNTLTDKIEFEARDCEKNKGGSSPCLCIEAVGGQ